MNLRSIGMPARWWIDTARALESGGFDSVWSADHFISRGRRDDSVLECWSVLAATAARTTRIRIGSWVANVMNRHPSVVAATAATIQDLARGRLEVGIGIGGHPTEHAALGLDFPPPEERVARLEEAVNVIRLLWSGGPASFEGRYYTLRDALVAKVSQPPRIIVAGETAAGARLAARIGDGWTTTEQGFARFGEAYAQALADAGRTREDVAIIVGVERQRDVALARQPLFADLRSELARWGDAGADEVIVSWVRAHEVPALLAAAEKAALRS